MKPVAQKDVLKVYLDSLLQEVFPEPDRAGLEPVDLNLRQVLEPSSVEKKELVVERKQ